MIELPSWLWFGLYYSSNPVSKWNDEKEKAGQEILKRLIEKAKQHDWNIEQIIRYEKYDTAFGYYPKDTGRGFGKTGSTAPAGVKIIRSKDNWVKNNI